MSKVEKATLEMYDDICALFFEGLGPEEKAPQIEKFIKPIFNYSWQRNEDHYGHVLVDNGRIVGFVGSFFVQRPINGNLERFCNLTTWRVKEEYRNESILLVLPFLRMKDCTVTGRTAAPQVFAIHEKLGFKYLDSKAQLVPTFTGGIWRKPRIEVVTDRNDLRTVLHENDCVLCDDHAVYKCRHVLIRVGSRYCYIIFSPVKKGFVGVAHIHYISDLELFLNYIDTIKLGIFAEFRIPILWIEERFLRGHKIPFSWKYTSKYLHIYKSNTLKREEIDNLYTELVIYNTLENRFF